MSKDTKIKDELFSTMLQEITKQKDELLKQRLKELKIDLKNEKRNRFKSLQINDVANKQTVYFNNSTMDGLRVITFTVNTKNGKLALTYY